MKSGMKKPFAPVERHETVRQEIIEALSEATLSAKDISANVRIPEKEAFEHLEHIRRSMGKGPHALVITPAQCRKCGFIFRKRDRLSKPGKCPVCRSESIEEPLFSIQTL